jgi:hypothetical protein
VAAPREFVDLTATSLGALGRFFTPGGISDFAGQVTGARDDRAEVVEEEQAASAPVTENTSRVLDEGDAAPSGEVDRWAVTPGLGAVDDHHQDGRRRGHAAADLRPRGAGCDIVRCTCNEPRRPRGWPRSCPGRRCRSSPTSTTSTRWRWPRSRPACTACGSTRATSAARAHQARRREAGPRRADPHRGERRVARPREAVREVRRQGHARGHGRVGADGARLLRRGRLRQREDLGEGVQRAADDRGLPPAVRGHRPSAAPGRHRGRARRRPASSRPPPASPPCSPRASATPSATRSPPTRSRRPAPAVSCSRRWGCASARTST